MLLGWIGSPIIVSIAVGMCFRVQFRYDLAEAKALARRMCLELDGARYELEQVSQALGTGEGDPPIPEQWPSGQSNQHVGGKHRLR